MNPVDRQSEFFSATGVDPGLKDTARASPVPIVICDTERRCIYVNEKWASLTGRSLSDESGDRWLNGFHPDDRLNFALACDSALGSSGSFVADIRIKEQSGAFTRVRMMADPIQPQAGSVKGFIAAFVPVNDLSPAAALDAEVRRRTSDILREQHALQGSSRILEMVLDSTLSMISAVDVDLNFILFNERASEHTGKRKDEVIGRNIFEVFPDIRETETEANIRKALAGELVHVGPPDAILEKGKILETFYIPLRTRPDAVDGVIIKVRDVTQQLTVSRSLAESNNALEARNFELQRQSSFIETLFDSIIDVIAVIDTGFRYISMNRSALEKYGLEKNAIIGKHVLDVFPVLLHSQMYEDLQKAMGGVFIRDLSYDSKVLGHRKFHNYYVPLKDVAGTVYAVMVIGHDVTDVAEATEKLKSSHDTLAQRNRELERSNMELEQFAYIASHDLQEPIRKIALYANKLLTRSQHTLPDETMTYLKRIAGATNRMYELINGLLMYSRVSAEGQLFVPTELEEVVRKVTADFETEIARKNAVVRFDRLPAIEGIPVQLGQMFSNLISNSLKFARKNVPPVIQISCTDLTAEQVAFYGLNETVRYINLFYLDNGIGFEQQFADRIFDLFQRLHDRHLYSGSGLGLAICRKIVTGHNGSIHAFSKPGDGVTFQIILPYSQKPFRSR